MKQITLSDLAREFVDGEIDEAGGSMYWRDAVECFAAWLRYEGHTVPENRVLSTWLVTAVKEAGFQRSKNKRHLLNARLFAGKPAQFIAEIEDLMKQESVHSAGR